MTILKWRVVIAYERARVLRLFRFKRLTRFFLHFALIFARVEAVKAVWSARLQDAAADEMRLDSNHSSVRGVVVILTLRERWVG